MPFGRELVDVGRRHAAADAAAVGTEIAEAGVVRHDHDDVGPLLLRGLPAGSPPSWRLRRKQAERYASTDFHCTSSCCEVVVLALEPKRSCGLGAYELRSLMMQRNPT